MDFTVNRQSMNICACVFDQMLEQPVDCEMILPDYCPDVARVLRCKADAKIVSKRFSGNRLDIEGTITINVIYVEQEEGDIRCHELVTSFDRSIEVDGDGDFTAEITTRADYISCRALTPRKLDIHSAAMLNVRVFVNKAVETVSSVDGINIEMLTKTEEVLLPICQCEKYLTLNEEMEIPSTLKPVRSFLRTCAVVTSPECRAVGEKAVAKGDLQVKMIYTTDTKMRLEKFEDSIPFSQIIDIPELDEEAACVPSFEVCSLEVRPRTGMDGECRSVMLTARILITIKVIKKTETVSIMDAYSTAYNVGLISAADNRRRSIGTIDEAYLCKKNIELPKESAAILDMWCETDNASIKTTSNELAISGNVIICLLATDVDGIPMYTERSVDYTYKYDIDLPTLVDIKPIVSASSAGFTMLSQNEIEVRVELKIKADVFENQKFTYLTDIELKDAKNNTESPALCVCYADEGERLWDIARYYNTTVSAIKSANDIESDRLDSGAMLLIPGV